MRRNRGFLLALVAALCASAQTPDGGDSYKISADVNRVVLPVTVVDRKGEPVAGLQKDNFRVLDDGKPCSILYFSQRDVPITVGLVVDNSGSMSSKRDITQYAALDFSRQSNPADEMFVLNFNENVKAGLPPGQAFSSDSDQLIRALSQDPAAGKTALYDAIATGLEHLKNGTRDKKALVVISDGGDNASSHTLQQVLDLARHSNAMIYTIGLFDSADEDRNPGVLRKLAHETGGEMYLPQQLKELPAVCERIAKELRQQYTIGFAPPAALQDGSYHKVEVKAVLPARGKLSVRTRPGYYAPHNTTGGPA